jgi:O-antigen ligase
LGFLSGILFIGFLQSRKILIGGVIILILFFVFGPQTMKERAFSVVDPSHPNNIERTYLWKAGIDMIKDHPIVGVSDIDLGELYVEYKSPEAEQLHGHMHNNLIMFGVTLGIPGLIVMIALFVRIFLAEIKLTLSIPKEEWLLKSTAMGSLAAFIGFQINGLFEYNFGDAEIAMLLWLTVGMALAVKGIRQSTTLQS